MSDAELEQAVIEGNVFARIEPDTKRKLIAALKRQGQYVAMVGDGVNDVPALKEAHLAVAMNDGAQIAKDIADIVLLNNALTTLPLAFTEGRTDHADDLRHEQDFPGQERLQPAVLPVRRADVDAVPAQPDPH